MKIAGVIVTYNRKEMLINSLKCLLNQSSKIDKIFIIDNDSTEYTDVFKSDLLKMSNNIEYVKLKKNLGGSEGFYQGVKIAYEQGFDYIWGMDDDAFADKFALENLLRINNSINDIVALWSNCNNDNDFNKEYKFVEGWMFVGFFLPRIIIQKVGFPRRDFFIYHDDSEYADRIIKNGFKIVKVKNSIIKHGDFSIRPSYKKYIIFKELEFPKMPDWKLYYYVRNYILRYSENNKKRYKTIFITIPKLYAKVLLLNKNQCKIILQGYIDGIKSITGKKEF